MSDRVVLFLDYQNVYRGAREIFHPRASDHTCGQIDPLKLGQSIVDSSPFDRVLKEVRVYRGKPDSSRDSKGFAACTRQVDIWEQDPRVVVTTRMLRYPYGWPNRSQLGEKPQEKGIDVALAIDFVAQAVAQEYDVGILMSTDTDLKPALEFVADRTRSWGKPRAEVAAWSGEEMHSRRLSIAGSKLWCHWLDADTYGKVKDDADYSRPL